MIRCSSGVWRVESGEGEDNMLALIRKRIIQTVMVCIGLSMVVFMLMNVNGDLAQELLPKDASNEQIEEFRHSMGLDRPLPLQYFDWVSKAVVGDFGESWRQGEPAFKVVVDRLPATFRLAIAAEILALAVAIPLGVIAASLRNSIWDRISMAVALVGQAMPHFWLGLMMILFLSVRWRLLPPTGSETLAHMIMPVITLSLRPMARTARLVRSGMLEVLSEDYIRTARSKGLGNRVVLMRHALRNALLPIITIVGLEMGSLLNGSVVVESVFAWPGVGRLIVSSLKGADIPVVEASVFIIAVMYILVNLVVDISYGAVDPRVRFS